MNQTKSTSKKLLALLLALIMTVSLLPVSVFAEELATGEVAQEAVIDLTGGQQDSEDGQQDASQPGDGEDSQEPEEEPVQEPVQESADTYAATDEFTVEADNSGVTTVIACSDFQHPNGDATGVKVVTDILNKMKNDGVTEAEGFLCAGDYSYGYSDDSDTLESHIIALNGAVVSVYPKISHKVYVQGNHDRVAQGTGGLSESGAHDADQYGVFVINEDDYMWYNNRYNSSDTSYSNMTGEQIVRQTANNLKAYLDKKTTEGYNKPIFVVSHLPLHYSMRTYQDGDGTYANLIFDVLNDAGANGLNIIFMYGHNHSHGWDDYLGGSHVYLAKGDSIIIAQGDQYEAETKTLNFTYLNAGYTGYYSYNSQDKSDTAMGESAPLTMTVFQITDTQVTVKRYGRNGTEALKNAGESKCDNYSPEREAANGCPVNALSYGSPQTITLTDVTPVPGLTIDGEVVSGTYTVNMAQGKTLAIGTQNFDGDVTWSSEYESVATVDNNGTVTLLTTGETTITATGDAVTASVTLVVTDSSVTPTERTYTRVTSTEQLESGKQYLLIYNRENSDDDYFMKPEVTTDGTRTGFKTNSETVIGGAKGEELSGDYIAYEWTLTGSTNDGWKLSAAGGEATLTSTTGQKITAKFSTSGNTFAIGGSVDNFTFTSDNNNYVLNYNDRGLINGYASDPALFYIYMLTSEGTSTDPETPTSKTIYMYVGQTRTDTITGAYYKSWTNNNPDAVGVQLGGSEATAGKQTFAKVTVTCDQLINSNKNSWTDTGYYYQDSDGNYQKLYAKRSEKSNKWYTYNWGYGSDANSVTSIRNQTTKETSATPNITVYEPTTTASTPASTKVTFTAKKAGTAVVVVGSVTYTVNVRDKAQMNDYPEYPNEGSVRVNKTGQGIDFQNTGVAKIELSTTGVPMTKGVDVILMLDTSSSMNDEIDGKSRIAVLRESVANMLASFNEPDATTGATPDIRVAIADFNGYDSVSDTAIKLDLTDDYVHNTDTPSGAIQAQAPTNTNNAQVYTGENNAFDASAFVLANNYDTDAKREELVKKILTKSGTNYDQAFYGAYQLGNAIQEANKAEGVERDLYVVFMSDGAPFQYNGYSSNSSQSNWNNWLTGDYTETTGNHMQFYNSDGRNWWAEAIKGTGDCTVINKSSAYANSNPAYMTTVSGLGAKMYAIGFCLNDDKKISVDTMQTVLNGIATSESYYKEAKTAADLEGAFTQIATDIKKAGYDAVFTDVMGDAYTLQIKQFNTKQDKTGETISPTITVSTYPLYKVSEVGETISGDLVTADMVGTRKGDATVVEIVTFNADGTEAYSSLKGADENILTDNKINAVNFTYDLAKETFTWNVGEITEEEKVLSYYVYLSGSMDGKRGAGSYPTNESAVLTYKNWLDHDAHKDTTSPVMPWESANVSYAFYLVDAEGKPVTNQTTGATGSFTDAVKVTQPAVYSEVMLNATEGEEVSATIAAASTLPTGYTLYDTEATYTVIVNSGDGGGSWSIKKSEGLTDTTYVTQYDTQNSAAATNKASSADVNDGNNDYTHTVVWFAVKYQISAVPDAVVIDFGLPVDISVLGNDILGENAAVKGLAKSVPDNTTVGTTERADGFGNIYTGAYGTATIVNNKVRYTPTSMQMNGTEKFAYAAQAGTNNDQKYYYSTVTVIPAANIYYEDSFVKFSDEWTTAGKTEDGITQQEDRPGKFSLSAYDANNVYGYDSAYTTCAAYSLGSAQKVTVNSKTNANPPTATFTFTGTGFDLISLTSNTTGTILVDVYKGTEATGTAAYKWIVDTFYGYSRYANGFNKYTWSLDAKKNWHVTKEQISELPDDASVGGTPKQDGDITYEVNYNWQVTTDSDNALYQIPVIRGQGLEYGTYTVKITPKYSSARDHANKGSYDFYLDAVRIYDPAGQTPDGEIGDAYKADGEGWPNVIELRNLLIDANTLNNGGESGKGIVFVDGVGNTGNIADYTNYGPNNEVYLAAGQAIAFKLSVDPSKIDSIQLAAKAPDGTATAQVNSGTATPITTATEMYYTITHRVTWSDNTSNASKTSDTIVVANIGDNILSLTNLKITYKEEPASEPVTQVDAQVIEEAPAMLLSMLGIEAPAPEPDPEPVVFVPERFEASWSRDTVKVGQKATLTVKTSEDVDAITVNGETIDTYRTRTQRTGWGWNAKKVTYREFTYTITANEAGTLNYSVAAVNAEGVASEPVVHTLTVQAAAQRPGWSGWLGNLFGRWF